MNVGSTQKIRISVFLMRLQGAHDQASTCALLQYVGLRLIKLLNRLQSLLSAPLSYNCRISCGLELVCGVLGWEFFLFAFFPFYTTISYFLGLSSACRIDLLLW